MTQFIINTSSPNSGQGDSAYSAFNKCNANFTDLYTQTTKGLTQAASANAYAPNASINRLNDRVFVGGATTNDGTYPPAILDWLSTYLNSVGYTNFAAYGKLFCLTGPTTTGGIGATFGANGTLATSSAGSIIGVESFAVTNSGTYSNNAWAYYGEAHRRTSGNAYGMELDVYNGYNASGTPNPFSQGTSVALQLANGCGQQGATITATCATNVLTITSFTPNGTYTISVGDKVYGAGIAANTTISSFGTGTGTTGTYNLSTSPGTLSSAIMSVGPQFSAAAAIQIEPNPHPFQAGIVFGSSSLQGCDGVSGNAPALSMAKGHQLAWYNATQNQIASIYSTVATYTNGTRMIFTDNGVQFGMLSGGALAYFFPVTTPVNYFTFTAAATGSSPVLQATGSDANVDLDLRPGGSSGTAAYIKFGTTNSFASISTNTVTISNLGPSTLTSATIGRWLKIKDNAGAVWGIPLWALSS